ncbi:bifunctional UDP-N-acetylglucosamine diphosphorylase/glucosamine-1-phosphate N-acetyltransferase GlmU [Fructilactobacillus fructivorans]|uniref:Bifunctional protein GlmU n=1 Tax=Fructilactobacillus fructivorans TaxID=1614 RepID=A0AAE6P1H3_9LACO|nr:bifunctional UDP-N-acetylglucosamine diphosphorylase/glucosamine-1-phosphate N-acetyltransferase GlmU [Fructilactobacillus fructivorans]KRK57387.1 Bifunctional protein glmU [Fructilactobacillus fructivorans]KRN41039.1 Bifunctional protein glmU [Fructilactobacillus fructivorans]KRN42975.1 Bifunctional protein glmU [Fructilactobacillus fructivorans]QFX93070.1 bifunctional UDP-N-acetylglucosamine diphosphorylase/glucosamine-1-phosphate N-acetyltransferase GlmU [Fructilactobacillus fructivorans]
MSSKNTIILAAGKGTRMKSKLYKVLHRICGKSMVDHVLTQVSQLDMDNIITIVGYGAEDVENELGNRCEYVVQDQQLGTGDAVARAEGLLKDSDGETLVISGDTPLFTAATLKQLFEYHEQKKATATILTSQAPDPTGYGRIVRNNLGIVEKIVEQKDATSEEQGIHEINTGVYVFDNQALFEALHKINNDNAQGEYYLTDAIEVLKNEGRTIAAYKMANFNESMGVNDRIAQARATHIMQDRINRYHMKNGVTIVNPDATYIDSGIKIGQDTIIEPGVQLQNGTEIGSNCVIGAHSKISGSKIHDNVHVFSSVIEDAEMMPGSDIGPNSHLRPGAEIGKNVHIGNFCEVKSATIGEGTKMGHLTYVGNAKLGKHINIGCGVIFANYDGAHKHTSTVGDDSFIGSNSNLIAPVHIADHTFIAAGSTITDDMNQYDMGIARERQTNKPGYYKKLPFKGAN